MTPDLSGVLGKQSVILLFSSGLDSVCSLKVLRHALSSREYDYLVCMYFNMGLSYQASEVFVARRICKLFSVPLIEVNCPIMSAFELDRTYVPQRNAIFSHIAAAWGEYNIECFYGSKKIRFKFPQWKD